MIHPVFGQLVITLWRAKNQSKKRFVVNNPRLSGAQSSTLVFHISLIRKLVSFWAARVDSMPSDNISVSYYSIDSEWFEYIRCSLLLLDLASTFLP